MSLLLSKGETELSSIMTEVEKCINKDFKAFEKLIHGHFFNNFNIRLKCLFTDIP